MNDIINLQVKCYLLPEAGRVTTASIERVTEIRRFVLTHPWTGLYEELLAKLASSFAGFVEAKTAAEARLALCTYWQDEERELVGFGSDDEMRYANDLLVAFAQRRAGPQAPHVFKVYVSTRAGATKAAPHQEPQVHHGVVCDGCGQSGFAGLRFKCAVCPDFDLCARCESSGVHKETQHEMKTVERAARCPYGGRGGNWQRGPRRHHHAGGAPGGMGAMFANLGQYMPMMNNPEEMKKFGEHFKSFMEPFGVDVDYFVDQNGMPQKKEDVAPKKEEQASEPMPEAAAEEKPKAPEASGSAPVLENAFMQAMHMMKNFGMTNDQLNKSASSVEESFVNVEVDAEKERELKVVKALDALKLMGYTDDGGWLTRLAIAKEGNINSVLDAIAPK